MSKMTQHGISMILQIARLALCHATIRAIFSFETVCTFTKGPIIEEISNIASPIACSDRCTLNDVCRSVYYYSGSQVCEISSQTTTYEMMSCPDQYKAMYGELIKATDLDVWIGDACDSGADCPQGNSACIESTCTCDNGYSYRYRDDSCVDFCQVYGSTFKEESYSIYGNNLEVSTSKTLAQCRQLCLDLTTICRFFEFDVDSLDIDDGICYLTNETGLTKPDDYKPENSPYCNQFLRGCA